MKIRCQNQCVAMKFDRCCHNGCPESEKCPEKCEENPETCKDAVYEGGELEVFQNKAAKVIESISLLVKQKAEIETAEKEMREQLQKAMDEHGIKSFDNEIIKVTYIEPTTRQSVDSTKLKAKYLDIAAECTKTSNVKGFVKIELKEGKKK